MVVFEEVGRIEGSEEVEMELVGDGCHCHDGDDDGLIGVWLDEGWRCGRVLLIGRREGWTCSAFICVGVCGIFWLR